MSDFSWFGSVIIPLVSAGIALFTGIRVAVWLQDRTEAMRRRSAAAALRTDVQRILEIMRVVGPVGTLPSPKPVTGFGPAVTAVHPWVEGLIVQLAHADPRIIAAYMQLQDRVNEWQDELSTYRNLAHSLAVAEGPHNFYQGMPADPKEAERLRPLVAEHAERFLDVDSRQRAFVEQLERLLAAQVNAPLPPLIPQPPDEMAASRLRESNEWSGRG